MIGPASTNPAEEAFARYSAAVRRHAALMRDPKATSVERAAQAHQMLKAESVFRRTIATLDAPTPADQIPERNRLACEGTLLLSAVGAFTLIFLPDMLDGHFWPLALTFTAAAALGVWTYRVTGRLVAHIGRRL